MYYKVSGKGKAVVLLHGFIEEGSMWDAVSKVLSLKYKVIVPDLEGFGNSKLETLTSKLSMEKYADDVFEMLKTEKVKSCVLLGHSMGGYVTLQFAEKFPDLLSGFGLLNSHCFEDAPEKKENRRKGNEFILKHGTKVFVKELYRNLFHPSFKNEKLIATLTVKAEKYSPEALIAANTAMINRKGKEDVLKNAKVPVLLVGGKQDPAAPIEFFLKQSSMPPVVDFHIFDNTKHMSMFEKKKETLSAIQNFVERCS